MADWKHPDRPGPGCPTFPDRAAAPTRRRCATLVVEQDHRHARDLEQLGQDAGRGGPVGREPLGVRTAPAGGAAPVRPTECVLAQLSGCSRRCSPRWHSSPPLGDPPKLCVALRALLKSLPRPRFNRVRVDRHIDLRAKLRDNGILHVLRAEATGELDEPRFGVVHRHL